MMPDNRPFVGIYRSLRVKCASAKREELPFHSLAWSTVLCRRWGAPLFLLLLITVMALLQAHRALATSRAGRGEYGLTGNV